MTLEDEDRLQKRLALMFGEAWFPAPPPIESDRIRTLVARGLQTPPRLSASEVQELASSIAAYHSRLERQRAAEARGKPAGAAVPPGYLAARIAAVA